MGEEGCLYHCHGNEIGVLHHSSRLILGTMDSLERGKGGSGQNEGGIGSQGKEGLFLHESLCNEPLAIL